MKTGTLNQMPRPNKFKIPPRYIFLDALGSVMVGLGIYGLIMTEEPAELVFLHLKRDAWELIMVGVLLMLPMVVHIIRNVFKPQDGDE
jgi:hypothetical protein